MHHCQSGTAVQYLFRIGRYSTTIRDGLGSDLYARRNRRGCQSRIGTPKEADLRQRLVADSTAADRDKAHRHTAMEAAEVPQ